MCGIAQEPENFNDSSNCYSRPTLYEAQKWLREKHNLNIEIYYSYGNKYLYEILTIPRHDLIGFTDREPFYYKSYEKALNDGIKEGLKLITA